MVVYEIEKWDGLRKTFERVTMIAFGIEWIKKHGTTFNVSLQ